MKSFFRIAIIAGVWLASAAGLAFSHDIDSLKQLTSSMDKTRDKVDNLFAIMQAYFQESSYDSARAYSEETYSIAADLNYPERMADALYYQSMIHQDLSELSKAASIIRQYIQLVKPMKDSIRLAKGYLIYSIVLDKLGHPDSAINYMQENIKMGRAMPDTMMQLITYNGIGNIYQDLSQFDSATYYYLESAKLCELFGKQHYLGNIYNNLGKTFMRMNQYDEAEKYFASSLEYHRIYKNDRQTALTLSNLGRLSFDKGDWQKAREYNSQALSIYKTINGELIEVADLYNNLAEIYEKTGDYDLALSYLKKAHAIYTREKYLRKMTISLVNMGNIYTAMGKYSQAQIVLDSSLALALQTGAKDSEENILWAIADNYYKSGNYKKAYEFYDQFHAVHSEIFEIERAEKINELSMQYNNERIQKENLALKNNNLGIQLELRKKTNQRNIFFITGIGLILLILFMILYLRQRITISRQKIRQLEEEKKLLSVKLLVEAQEQERKRIARDLHDSLGVILSATKMQFSSIIDKSPANKPLIDRAMQLLEQATGDVRKISHNMMPGLLTRLGLYEAVGELFDNIADSNDYTVDCDIENGLPRLPENSEIMIYRIIQEWVNNTLRHATARHISLKIYAAGDQLLIEYGDNGKGYDPVEVMTNDSESLGLKSIRSRVDFLNGKLDTETAPGQGVRYSLSIPLTK